MLPKSEFQSKRSWIGLITTTLFFLPITSGYSHLHKYDYGGMKVFEVHRAPPTFKKLETAPPSDHTISLRIGLKNRRLEESIEDLLVQTSDSSHPSFRHHLSDAEVTQQSQPTAETVEKVLHWLETHGFEKHQIVFSKHKEWATVEEVALPKVEEMLKTTYSVYRHADGEHLIRTESYSLPKHLHEHIDLVQPTTMFGRLSAQRKTVRVVDQLPSFKVESLVNPKIPNTCSDPRSVTNNCLRKLYKTEGYRVKHASKNAIGITGYLGEPANFADAHRFLSTQRVDQVNQKFQVVSVHGGQNPQELSDAEVARRLGVEANLDTQTALGITAPTKNIFYTTAGSPPFIPDITSPSNTNEPYLDWLSYILDQPVSAIPKVISTSYGDNEQTVPLSYARRVCNGFAQLGTRGVSVIFSSGDYGVGQDNFCWANDGSSNPTFLPIFPASCPYVTSVGATENFWPEVAVSESGPGGFYSGGGFSNYFKRPSWQDDDVGSYLEFLGSDTYPGMFNPSGRGFPDVSAQGAQYVIAYQGSFLNVGGTSASAPTFASVIALLNDYSISLGGSSLGYLNPWLYSMGRYGLNDITSGSSAGCNTTGFSANYGWDPVTGLGTPDFKRLQDLVRPWSLNKRRADFAETDTQVRDIQDIPSTMGGLKPNFFDLF